MSTVDPHSIRAVTAQIKLKNLRAASAELAKLEPHRKEFRNFDRLMASVYGPLNNAEKFLFEAQALIPGMINHAETGEDPAGMQNRTRRAISKLIKARHIVKDDRQINALLKRCLAALEAAESKVSVAQSHAVRGQWDEAYKNIREAAQFDDSPDVQETNKYIAKAYKGHLKDNAQLQLFIKAAKITGFVFAAAIVGVLIYTFILHDQTNEAWKASERALHPVARAAHPPAPAPAPQDAANIAQAQPPAGPPPNATPQALAAAKLSPEDLAEQEKLRLAAEESAREAERIASQKPYEKELTVNAGEEMGASLGKLAVGTQVALHYESGTWCAWLNPKGFSPDQPAEGGKINCAAIIGIKDGAVKVLKVVGYRTKESPFVYTIAEPYDKVALRINDQAGSFDNNNGEVIYGVLVTPPVVPASAQK